MTRALALQEEAWTDEEIAEFLRDRLGEHLLDTTFEYATFTVHVDATGYVRAAELLFEEPRLGCTMFDCLFGIDAREEGFDVVAILYAPEFGHRVCLRHRCEGGREAPVAPTLTHLYEGADWMERETWDMFGIEFEGHPGLEPRILTVENFEGWPLRKDFYLGAREAKPWPGVKEPAELDDEGNVIVRKPAPGDASGPMALDEAMAEQAKRANPEAESETVVVEPEGGTAAEDGQSPGADVDEELETDAEGAEVATDSGRVVAGEPETGAEVDRQATVQDRAEQERARKQAAEERARRAAERSQPEEAPQPDQPPETAEDEARATSDPETGSGPPGDGGADKLAESDVRGGIDETVEDARRRGTVDTDAGDPPVTPEGRQLDEPDEPAAADDLEEASVEDAEGADGEGTDGQSGAGDERDGS